MIEVLKLLICGVSDLFILNPTHIYVSRPHTHLSFSVESQQVHVARIYASTNPATRKELWRYLQDTINGKAAPWLLIGEFNATLGAHEQRGRIVPSTASCADFRNWTDSCSLLLLFIFQQEVQSLQGLMVEILLLT